MLVHPKGVSLAMGSPRLPLLSFNEQCESAKSNPINISMKGKFIPAKRGHFFSTTQLTACMLPVTPFIV